MIYNPQTKSLKELEDSRNLWIKSRMKFGWDFKELLKELISALEVGVAEKIIKNYGVEYTSYWDQIIKIKIKDKNLMIEKLIICTLVYNNNDKRYWNITPIFVSEEKWQKPKKHQLKSFSIMDTKIVVDAIVEKLEEIIEEF